ncbi:MAG: DNA-3-methyladenine glycosylase I [Anaerolineales bacterium]
MTSYCQYVLEHPEDTFNNNYHDTEYGFPIEDDNLLFERLVLEINQAGLSWITILKKAENFRKAYDGFDVETVAGYGESDRARLLADAGIIRNKLKVNAAIVNAGRILEIQKEFGSFKNWLDAHHPMEKGAWVKLFRQHFKFVGGEIVGEFLMSTGYLPGAHDEDCPVFARIAKLKPAWMR